MGRIYIDRYTGRIERTDLYLVRLILKDGSVIENLEPRRLFPLSNRDRFITLLDADEKEIGFVRELDEIDEDSRKALEECFREFYLIPHITRVIEADEKFGSLKWSVDTDRGPVSFRIRSRHNDIKQFYGTRRVLIRDSDDNRYEIPDIDALDAHSQRILFSYL